MEKKKLLLIAVSLGIFLVIVIGLSILIFAPKKDNTTAYTPSSNGTAVVSTPDTSGASLPATSPITLPSTSVRDDTPARGVGTGTSSPSVTVEIAPPATGASTQAASSTTSVQSLTPKVSSTSTASQSVATKGAPNPVAPAAIRPATTISESTQSASASTSPTTSSQSATRTSTTTARVATQSAPATSTTHQTQPTAASTTRQPQPTSSATSTSARKAYESYWVQAGAFSTQVRAEDVKETLKTKGLAAVIETHNVQGKDFYRVRVGPYTSQNEADYWLARIKDIDGFEESQIWQNNVVR